MFMAIGFGKKDAACEHLTATPRSSE